MRAIVVAASALMVCWISSARAVDPSPPNDVELKSLPNFCALKLRGGAAEYATGFSLLGEQFKNSHHYCMGLNFLNRYYRAPFSQDAKSTLKFAYNEFTYMAEHLVENSSLAGEVFVYRGIANALLKNDVAATEDFAQAIARNPRLPLAYVTLADYYSDHKQKAKALDVVTQGLRNLPDNKALKRRYQELGGKLPYPEPVAAAQPAPEAGESAAGPAASDAVSSTAPTQDPAGEKPESAAQRSVDKAAVIATDPSQDSAADSKGTPKKPWCRFCPDEP